VSQTRLGILVAGGLALCGLVAFLLLGSHGTKAAQANRPPASHPLDARSFTAAVPAGWAVAARAAGGARGYHLSSTGARINPLGIGPKGTIGITVTESGPGVLAHGRVRGRRAGSYSAPALLPAVIGTPGRAVSVKRVAAPAPRRLAGRPAAEEAFTYAYRGRKLMQVDVLAKHGGRLFVVELDAEPALATRSEAALQAIFGSWRWR